MNTWVYRGVVKTAYFDHETGRTRIVTVGVADGYWRLFAHGGA